MKKALPIITIGAILILILDMVGSIASRKMHFDYSYSSPIFIAIYIYISFTIAKRTNRDTAIISAGFLGLVDATVGWKLSLLLRANTNTIKLKITPLSCITTILWVVLLASLYGLVGSWLATRYLKSKKV